MNGHLQVVPGVGLCICFYDFVKIGDSFLLPGDGAAHTKGQSLVHISMRQSFLNCFSRLSVCCISSIYRRSIGGKDRIVQSTRNNDQRRLIRRYKRASRQITKRFKIVCFLNLLTKCNGFNFSDEADQIWYWEYPSDDGEEPAKLYMDPGKQVRYVSGVLLLEFDSICRFRVVEEQFADTRPVGEQQQPGKEGSDQVERPYTIVVSGWM
jgi:hypothetical protein